MRFVLANMVVISFLAVALFFQYFLQSPEESIVPVSSKAITALRTPAAAPANLAAPEPSKALPETKTVELDMKMNLSCKDSLKEIVQVQSSMILNMKKCGKEFPKAITVENLTNGFTASLFSLNENFSKTDTIPLKKGKNMIVIKYILAKSKSLPEQQITERLSVDHD